ncbi:UBN2_2 domain-containing protein, partial [Cephalotus follicularis]
QHEHMETLGVILLHLKELYDTLSRTARFNQSRQLFWMKIPERASVHAHGLKMIDLIEQFAQLDCMMDNDFYIDLILTSFPQKFSQFISNFYMNKVDCLLPELVAMLRTVEADFDIGKAKKNKKKAKSLGVIGRVAKEKVKQLSEDKACFHCGKQGHWKRDYKEFLASTSSTGASGSGTFMIELNLAYKVSSTWVLDTGYGTNICNSLQGLRNARLLGAEDAVDQRLGDGFRIITRVVGVFYLHLPIGYVLTLNPCYFV